MGAEWCSQRGGASAPPSCSPLETSQAWGGQENRCSFLILLPLSGKDPGKPLSFAQCKTEFFALNHWCCRACAECTLQISEEAEPTLGRFPGQKLAGTAVLAIGLWLRFDSKTKDIFEQSHTSTFYTGLYILIGAGALIMLVGFLGCCGAIQESQCMLSLFFLFLLLIFALEIGAAIWGFSNKEKIVEEITNFYNEAYDKKSDPEGQKTLKAFQFALNCCGRYGSPDKLILKDLCPEQDTTLDAITIQSCPTAIHTVFTNKVNIIGIVGIVIGVVMIFGMIFSMILCCAIRRSREMV